MSLLFTLVQAAAAASAPALPTAPAETQGQQAVTRYPASFFTALNAANALDMANHIPGFTLDTGAAVRGYEGAAGNVLIDGRRPSSKSDSIDQILQRIPVGQVERIDVIRGGAPGIDMQGKTVLANVIRKTGGGLKGLAAVADGYVVDDQRNAPSLRLEAQGGRDGRAWEVSVRGGFGIDSGSGPGPEVKTAGDGAVISRNAILARGGGWQSVSAGSYELPLAGGQFRLNGRFFTNNYDNHETDVFSLPAGQLNRDHFSDEEVDTELGGRFSRAVSGRADLEIVGLHTTKDENIGDIFTQRPGPEDNFRLHRYSTETIGRGVVKFRQTARLSWEAGGEAADNRLESRTRFAEDGVAIVLPSADVQVEEKRWEGFVKAIWRPTDSLSLEGAVRQEGSTIDAIGDARLSKSLGFTKPRVALTWAPSAVWQVRLRFEREVGQLNFDDFVAKSSLNTSTVTAGNPNLNPEQAWVSEAAVERDFWGAGSLVITARHYALTDAVDRAPIFLPGGGFFDAPANIGNGTKDELNADLTLPMDRLGLKGAQLKGSYIHRWSEVTDPTVHRTREISSLRPDEWALHFSQPLPRWNANWGIDTAGGLPWRQTVYRADVIEDTKLKVYVVPFVEWKPRPDIQLHLEIQNITEGGGIHDVRRQFAGPRNLATLGFTDDRDTRFGRIFYVRLRKYFGA
ncbi:TonB-dependent receptor plug domain-containing protein [Phenylobacterium sp.]|uniref:TonB-dependent receptor plug domain-containing protein n=1 Tax=Phenylobacterium sp. TaxID=1871053 RepID=UPI003563CD90